MNIKTFIDRPVLSTVISIVIVIGGLIGLASLPIERYPNIAPPTIFVSASYPGASAETVQKSVLVPLEEAINGVENMTYMSSAANNNGGGSVTIYFKQGINADMAAVNVQNRVTKAQGFLPSEVTKAGVTTSKKQSSISSFFQLLHHFQPKRFLNNLRLLATKSHMKTFQLLQIYSFPFFSFFH